MHFHTALESEKPEYVGHACDAYYLPLVTCLAAVAWLFFLVLALSFACFCTAFLFVAFGDLSPIIHGESPPGALNASLKSDVVAFGPGQIALPLQSRSRDACAE